MPTIDKAFRVPSRRRGNVAEARRHSRGRSDILFLLPSSVTDSSGRRHNVTIAAKYKRTTKLMNNDYLVYFNFNNRFVAELRCCKM